MAFLFFYLHKKDGEDHMELFKILGTIALNGAEKSKKEIQEISYLGGQTAKKLQDMGGKITNVGKKVSSAGAKITAGMVAIGAAVVGAGTAVYGFATKAAAVGDNVDKMSQKIGISREAYQELDFICSQSGTSVDTLQMGLKTMTNTMQAASEGTGSAVAIFEKLGVAVTDSSGNLRSQEDVMWDCLSALQGMENQTEKAALANDLFGRSGSELMPLLNAEAGSIEAMKQQAHDLNLVLSDEAVDASVKLTDTLDQMKRSLSVVGTEIGVALMPYIQRFGEYVISKLPQIREVASNVAGGFERIVTAVRNVITWFQNLSPAMQNVVTVIGIAIVAIGPVLTVLGGIISGIGTLMFILPLLLSPIGLIVAAVAAVIAIIIACIAHWDEIKAKIEETANNISAFMQALRDDVVQCWQNLQENVATVAENIRSKVSTIFEAIRESITDKINLAKEAVNTAITKIKEFFNFSWSLPPLKLPRITISGNFSLNPVSVPTFGLEWFAKGGILNDPTIFGMNPFTGNAMVGGEAGAEAIAPISTLKQYVTEAVNEAGSASVLREIANILSEFRNSGMPINIDISTELDGATVARKLYKYNLLEQRNHGTSLINA